MDLGDCDNTLQGMQNLRCSIPLEGQVLIERKYCLSPEKYVGWLVHALDPVVDERDGVPKSTKKVSE